MDSTAKSMVEHWNWAAEKGLLNSSTARALRAASSQILSVLDNWETIDVSTVNADDVFQRFKHLRAKDFTPDSLNTYESRFKRAMESYLAYVKDPGAWKHSSQSKPRKGPSSTAKEREMVTTSHNPVQPPPEPARIGLVDYPFPIRDNLTARLMLPRDLKNSEVKRLSAFMSTLAVDGGSS